MKLGTNLQYLRKLHGGMTQEKLAERMGVTRQTWGDLNPVTRKPESSKAYNRNKARNWKREDFTRSSSGTFICIGVVSAI